MPRSSRWLGGPRSVVLDGSVPSVGQVPRWNGTTWEPYTIPAASSQAGPHAATHEGGSDPVSPSGIGAATTGALSAHTGAAAPHSGHAAASHGHAPSEITGTAVVDADPRMTDARTPTSHAHAPGDVTGTAVITNDARLSDARAPTAHGSAAHTGTIGTPASVGLPAITVGTTAPGNPAAGDLWVDTN